MDEGGGEGGEQQPPVQNEAVPLTEAEQHVEERGFAEQIDEFGNPMKASKAKKKEKKKKEKNDEKKKGGGLFGRGKKKETAEERALREKEEAKAAAEERRRQRELVRICILSINVAELPNAHPFAKNCPWLKCVIGKDNFEAKYIESNIGDKASWEDLNWTFLRMRNKADRADLVVVVGSGEVVIGRYVLGASEFDNIPETESGYFEVSGHIYSGLGPAGKIKLLCYKIPAERPGKAPPPEYDVTIVDPPFKHLPHNSRAFVKIISISLIEMKSVHLMERNSPCLHISCGKNWEKSTSVLVKAGSTGQWERLTWKLIMYPDSILNISVTSLSALIGRVCLPLSEMAAIKPDERGFTQV
jgi:hypothetical protein